MTGVARATGAAEAMCVAQAVGGSEVGGAEAVECRACGGGVSGVGLVAGDRGVRFPDLPRGAGFIRGHGRRVRHRCPARLGGHRDRGRWDGRSGSSGWSGWSGCLCSRGLDVGVAGEWGQVGQRRCVRQPRRPGRGPEA
ncbi:hypothetical protein C9J60_14355 [Streptomyces sp. A244]|nr:hypothetical protein C9J60_14355 [Streptomyces sp. A244]